MRSQVVTMQILYRLFWCQKRNAAILPHLPSQSLKNTNHKTRIGIIVVHIPTQQNNTHPIPSCRQMAYADRAQANSSPTLYRPNCDRELTLLEQSILDASTERSHLQTMWHAVSSLHTSSPESSAQPVLHVVRAVNRLKVFKSSS